MFGLKVFSLPHVTGQSRLWNLEISTCVFRLISKSSENVPKKPSKPLDLVEKSESFEDLSEVRILNLKQPLNFMVIPLILRKISFYQEK